MDKTKSKIISYLEGFVKIKVYLPSLFKNNVSFFGYET